jgi:tRNA pseudouridine55 synthase
VVRLGITTDTHDADGQILVEKQVTVSRKQLEAALGSFRGHCEQIPPMVSALKRDGEPLYKLARRGITVERQPRPIEIHELVLTEWSPPDFSLEISCSPGTYIRALARDLGKELGCGAHLIALTRLASGNFTLDGALKLEHFAAVVTSGRSKEPLPPTDTETGQPAWHRFVLPMDTGLQHLPAANLDAQQSRLVRTGRALPAAAISASESELCRAYANLDGRKLLALLRYDSGAQVWRPHKVFYSL